MKKNSSKRKSTKKIVIIFAGYIAGLIFCCAVTYAATYAGAIDVYYDNNNSKLVSTNVQGALDELYNNATALSRNVDLLSENIDKFYKVGSIYISTASTHPSELFGGSWDEFASGRVLVGVDEDDTDFTPIENSDGSLKMKSDGSLYMQAHSHTISNKNSNTDGAHTHSNRSARITENGSDKTIWNMNATTNYEGMVAGGGTHSHGFPSLSTNLYGSGTSETKNLMPYITVYMWVKTSY